MKVTTVAVIACAATFALTSAGLARDTLGNSSGSNGKRSGITVAVGDWDGDGLPELRTGRDSARVGKSSTIFDRWGRNAEKQPSGKR